MKKCSESGSPSRREFLDRAGRAAIATALIRQVTEASEPVSRPRRPNIVLLMADQFRGDCLGCDGNKAIRTPHLDRLAKEGARFSVAYSSTPTCTPARTALLTGLSPWNHGMLGFGRVSNAYPMKLPQALRDAGYYTFGIGKMHWHPQRELNGFHRVLLDESGRRETPDFISDYHQWFATQAPGRDPDATGIGWNDHRAAPYVLPEHLHPTSWTAQMAVDFITGYERSEPFFLKVSFARPHSPYDPPPRFWEKYRDQDMPSPRIGDWARIYAPLPRPFTNDLWHGDLGLDQVRRSRRGYYGSVSFVDEQIGRILNALERRGMLDDTFILFAADHGDMTGDHHLWRKSYAYEASARIPYLVRWPRGLAPDDRRGIVLTQPVELRDVLPTFMDVAGAAIPGQLDGRSLLPLLRGQSPAWRPWIDLEHDICYDARNHWNALPDGQWKYIFHAFDGTEQLFDLRRDPGELHDLAGDALHGDALKLWRSRLVEHLQERGERFVKDGTLVKRPDRMLYSPRYPGGITPTTERRKGLPSTSRSGPLT